MPSDYLLIVQWDIALAPSLPNESNASVTMLYTCIPNTQRNAVYQILSTPMTLEGTIVSHFIV